MTSGVSAAYVSKGGNPLVTSMSGRWKRSQYEASHTQTDDERVNDRKTPPTMW